MASVFAEKYGRAFLEILFVRLRSDKIKALPVPGQAILYVLALAAFYVPILYFAVQKCIEDRELIAYFVVMAAIHALAKFMLCSSWKIQRRFATIKSKKHFLMRTWLIVEYVIFMWLVYLFYPLTCLLLPFSLLAMSAEHLLGYDVIFTFFLQNYENFIFFGGIASYILFIVANGYHKLRAGFLPDYLGLYALLAIMSASIEVASQRFVEYFAIDISRWGTTLSWFFSLSNNAMNIVASAVALFFAVRSLYANCGVDAVEESGETLSAAEIDSQTAFEPARLSPRTGPGTGDANPAEPQ